MAAEASSTTDRTEIFEKLESYPWDKDTEFQGGLSAILGPNPTTQTGAQITDLTIRAQCFYLSRKKNIPIDFDAYKTYLTSKSPPQQESPSSTPTEQVLSSHPSNSTTQPQAFTPSTPQKPEPESQLSQPPTHHETDLPLSEPTTPEKQAPYPPTFAEIVALITSGAPIPGIKEIPDTLLTGQETKAVVEKRRKPWEKALSSQVDEEERIGGTFGDERDRIIVQDLPAE